MDGTDLGNAGGSGNTVSGITVCSGPKPQIQPDPGLQNLQPPVGGGGNTVSELIVTGRRPKKPPARNGCGATTGFFGNLGEGANNLSDKAGTAGLVSGGLGLATSETGVGFVVFEGEPSFWRVYPRFPGSLRSAPRSLMAIISGRA
jgi:hypothetical protein